MERIVKVVDYVQLRLSALFLVVFVLTISIQVLGRNFGFYIPWTEEVSNYSFIWMVFMGGAVLVNKDEHFRVAVLEDKFNRSVQMIISIIVHLSIIFFGLAMLYYGINLTTEYGNWTLITLPSLEKKYIWMSVPIAGATISLYSVNNLISAINSGRRGV